MDEETLTNYPDKDGSSGATSPSSSGIDSEAFDEPDFSGQTLNNYRLTRKLAEGGMGVVYEAVQVKLDRKVALKVLTKELSSRPEFLKRFEREAKAAAALNHPNLVQVYDFGEAQGCFYLIMEFVEGEDLAKVVQRQGKLSVDQALNYIEQAAQALKAACAKSIIHRDIKPANLMLTHDGCVKVSDLGLAKILTENSDMTLTGVGMGSPHFIAPEQADDSRHVDHRVDIYALGITLLYLLTGKKPFDGTSPYAVVLAHANKPLPTGTEMGTELPPAVEALIRRMAAKKPENRHQDYQSLIDDLQRVRRGEAPIAVPIVDEAAAAKKKRIAITVGLAVAVIIGVFIFFPARKPAPVEQHVAETTRIEAVRENPPFQREFVPERQPGPEQFQGGPPPEGSHVERLLGPLPMIESPLADGSVTEMFAAAEAFAKSNPTFYRDIIARFEQVQAKAAGDPLAPKIDEAVQKWTALRDEAAEKAMKEFKMKVDDLLAKKGHRVAMDYLRNFPQQLRSAFIDDRIVGEVAVPPPNQQGGAGRNQRPPPPQQP